MTQQVVLTGASNGIGAATAQRLQTHDLCLNNLDIVASTLPGIANYLCDLGQCSSIDQVMPQLPASIDSLVHVAGVAPGQFDDATVVAVNFLGLRHVTETLLPRIADGGSIVIVASSAGRDWRDNEALVGGLLATEDYAAGLNWLEANHSNWSADAYRFSKQCAAAYTYRAAGLCHSRGIRVNCVNPGIVDTQLSTDFRAMVGTDRYDWIVDQMGRAGTPDDVAQLVEFLTVGECGWLNGVEITIDGGYNAGVIGGWIDPEGYR